METVAILQKAKAELDEIANKLDALTKRRDQLQNFLATYQSLAADLVPGGAVLETPAAVAQPTEEPRTAKSIIIEAVIAILSEGQPKTTKQLMQDLTARGVEVGGADKVSNLAAILSREKAIFRNERGLGYSLIEPVPGKTEAVGADTPTASEMWLDPSNAPSTGTATAAV